MSNCQFDPDANKVPNAYGGYDPNEKGITQYPKYVEGRVNPSDCSFQNPFPTREQTSRRKIFSNPILDPVTRHYRRFVQDTSLHQPLEHVEHELRSRNEGATDECSQTSGSCRLRGKTNYEVSYESGPRLKKPINPVHWKSDLFDTSFEKYYLRNLLNEDPYREFLTSYSEATVPPHYFTEYKERFSGNPTLETSSLETIPGLSRPTDLTEPCDWRRNRTHKLRDVIFTHEKDSIDSHLDYNDPKRYNPWGRHLAGHALLIEPNYRPRPWSGIQFTVTTLLPAVSTHSRQWFI